MKFSDITEGWINSFPKTINENGCWIPTNRPTGKGYVPIMIKGISYSLHRIVVSIYYNLDYNDYKWDARHSKGCDKACFYIRHLQPGSVSDNQKDAVSHGTHFNASKTVCPKCGSEYKIRIIKTGWHRGEIQRICQNCRTLRNQAR